MTATPLSEEAIKAQILDFIRQRFLFGDPTAELKEDTPLLEFGVLDSLKVAILINFVREELSLEIPLPQVNSTNFKDVRSIAAVIAD